MQTKTKKKAPARSALNDSAAPTSPRSKTNGSSHRATPSHRNRDRTTRVLAQLIDLADNIDKLQRQLERKHAKIAELKKLI